MNINNINNQLEDSSAEMLAMDSTAEKAMKLLGNGYNAETVASACGVSSSRISQLMSQDWFASKVAELRFNNLQKHNEIDNTYDEMEAKLLGNLKTVIPMMLRPMEILKAVSVINAAKRRGSSAPEQAQQHATIVNLTLPNTITQRFAVNANNQVVSVGIDNGEQQTLVTIQSSNMLEAAKLKEGERNEQALAGAIRTLSLD